MYGGSEVTSASAFPFAVFLLTFQPDLRPPDGAPLGEHYGKVRICTGTLITPHWVLSAAHCFYVPPGAGGPKRTTNPEMTEIRAHYLNNNQTGGDFYYSSVAAKVITHPDYLFKARHDISLVMSSLRFPTLPDLHPIPLAQVSYAQFHDNCRNLGRAPSCTIFGYGEKYPNDKMTYVALHTMQIEALPTYRCPFRLIFLLFKSDPICYVAQYGRGPCMGDSGGPLICDNALTGVLSRGVLHEFCGSNNTPVVVYEDLSLYREWIAVETSPTIDNRQMAHRVNAASARSNVFFSNSGVKTGVLKMRTLSLLIMIAYFLVTRAAA